MPKDCRETALRYLEHRERSVYEVKSHLISRGFKQEEIEEELRYLKDLRYVDDARYCLDYISYGIGKGRGPVRLQFELAEKGIETALIQEALEERLDRRTERAAAMKEAEKVLRQHEDRDFSTGAGAGAESGDEPPGPEEKTVAKIGRKLAALGYHTEVIYDIIGQIRKT